MPDTLSNLNLPLLLPSQAQKHVTHNQALEILDSVVQLSVKSSSQTTPPASLTVGDRYIPAIGSTGDWLNQDGNVATWLGTSWRFDTPSIGWLAYDQSLDEIICNLATGWQSQPLPTSINNLDGLGINASSDVTNRLSISSPASLFNHEGAGHQIKINKATPTDTSSILFQTNWSGRIEIGQAGNDDLSIKVSPDGTNWTSSLTIDAMTGDVGGSAIQQSPTDTTAGKIMRADYGYSPGNVLGSVSQIAGVPSGAVIEQGTNSNGSYTRWADGTQICQMTIAVDVSSTAQQDFSFPVSFSGPRNSVSTTISHQTTSPNVSLRLSNVAGITGHLATVSVRLVQAGTSIDATSDEEKLSISAIGRWFT